MSLPISSRAVVPMRLSHARRKPAGTGRPHRRRSAWTGGARRALAAAWICVPAWAMAQPLSPSPSLAAPAAFQAGAEAAGGEAARAADPLSGRYRIRREPVAGDPEGQPPVIEVSREGQQWLLRQSDAGGDAHALRPFRAADYEALFAGQLETAQPLCAASDFAAICRVEPGTQPDPDEDFRSRTGYFLFSLDVGVVELEPLPAHGDDAADGQPGAAPSSGRP